MSLPARNPVPIASSELLELTSAHVGLKFQVKVRLPEDYYNTRARYPVLYLLDGDYAFAMATDIVQYLIYADLTADLVIVSPAYGSKLLEQYGGTNMRERDLLPFPTDWSTGPPGGPAFLQFLEHELMPFITATYRVDDSDRTLAGFSLGAYFVLYSLFERPGLFHRLIAIDGFNEKFLEIEQAFSKANASLPVKLFLASRRDHYDQLIANMNARGYQGLTIAQASLNTLGHLAVPAEGLTRGLVSVFQP